jgi:hypothetical protein
MLLSRIARKETRQASKADFGLRQKANFQALLSGRPPRRRLQQ